jgi:hypothetical protein
VACGIRALPDFEARARELDTEPLKKVEEQPKERRLVEAFVRKAVEEEKQEVPRGDPKELN